MMTRPSSRPRTYAVSWIHGDKDYIVYAEVTGAWTKGNRDEPPEGPDVDVIAVRDELGIERPDLTGLAADDPGLIDDILVDDQDAEVGSWEDEQERRAEARRDEGY